MWPGLRFTVSSSVLRNPLLRWWWCVYLFMLFTQTTADSFSCSLTLWNSSVGVRPAFSLSAGRTFFFFPCQIIVYILAGRLIQSHKCPGFCHAFVHVWSHISHLSLLGNYNLPEAFSRNPADSVIWNALWLFIIEFTHLWEDLQRWRYKLWGQKSLIMKCILTVPFTVLPCCWDCCSSALPIKLVYYHLNT